MNWAKFHACDFIDESSEFADVLNNFLDNTVKYTGHSQQVDAIKEIIKYGSKKKKK